MRYDIKRLLDDHSVPWRDTGKNTQRGWANINCPFCGDSGFHGGVNLEADKPYFNCWKCGWHSFRELLKALGISTGLKNYILYTEEEPEEIVKNPVQSVQVPGSASYLRMHQRYLRKRNFDIDYLIQKYDLRFTGHEDPDYKFRILFPIYYQGRIVSYQGRDVTGLQELRYKACAKEKEIIFHKDILYNLDNCTGSKIVIVEGIFDCIRIGDDCACTFGTGFTTNQIRLLSRYEEVVLLYDNEELAQEKAERLAVKLNSLGCYTSLINIDREDPAEMSEEDVKELKDFIFNDFD